MATNKFTVEKLSAQPTYDVNKDDGLLSVQENTGTEVSPVYEQRKIAFEDFRNLFQFGVEVYDTRDDSGDPSLPRFLPATGVAGTSYKVERDPITSRNGYYGWSDYTSDYYYAASLNLGVVEEGNVDAVSGDTVKKYDSYETAESLTLRKNNQDTDTLDTFMQLNGSVGTSTTYRLSDYIPVVSGRIYSSYRNNGSWVLANVRFITAFDTNFNVVESDGVEISDTYTVPSGIAYVRVTFFRSQEAQNQSFIDITDGLDGLGAEYHIGKKALEQEIAVNKVIAGVLIDEKETDNAIPSRGTLNAKTLPVLSQINGTPSANIMNPYSVTSGFYINEDGTIIEDVNYNHSDYIGVNELETYTGNIKDSVINVFRKVCYFDSEKNVILGGSGSFTNHFTTLANVAFVIVSFTSENNASMSTDRADVCLQEGTSTIYVEYSHPKSVRWEEGSESDFTNDNDLATKKNVAHSTGRNAYVIIGEGEVNRNEGGSYVVGRKSTREISPQRIDQVLYSRIFNFFSDSINGEEVRSNTTDDVAPSHFLGTTLLANHSYHGAWYLATDHGKTDADIGSVYSDGSNTFVLISIFNSGRLWLAAEGTNDDVYPENETMTYVSGGATVTNIDVETKDYRQIFPCHQDYEIVMMVDGREVDMDGKHWYKDNVTFNERYNLITRDSIIEWYKNSYDGTINVVGDVILYNTISYRFDVDGNCTIAGSYTFADVISVQDIMVLQAIEVDELTEYYIPKTKSFDFNGNTLDFSMKEASTTATDLGLGSIYINQSNIDASPIPSDRWLQLGASKGFAMGFLPLGSAGANRAANVSVNLLEIRGNTNKMYPRLVDKSDFNSTVGQTFNYVAYRNVFEPKSGATANYPVRTNGDDYYFVDYHNTAGLKEISMPNDYIGREIEVVESRNISIGQDVVSSKIVVNVDCVGDYSYLVIRIKK